MPSYYLSCDMNLGDIYDTSKSRSYLQIGPFDTTYSNNTHIYGGNISIDHFTLTNSTHINVNDFLIKSNDTLEWKANDEFLTWAFFPVILNSSFSNVDYYINRNNLSAFAFDGKFESLNNKPSIDALIPDVYDTDYNLYKAENNLSEITPINSILLNSNLFGDTLGNLAFEPEILSKVRFLHFNNFSMKSEKMLEGSFLYSSHIINDDLLMQRNKVIWNHPFCNDINSVKDEFILIDDFLKNKTQNSSVKVSNLNFFHTDLLNKVNIFQNNLDISRVQSLITNNVINDTYLCTSNMLADVIDINQVKTNLNIGSLASYDNDFVTIDKLFILEKFEAGNFSGFEDFNDLYFSYDINNSNLNATHISFGHESNLGYAQLNSSASIINNESYEYSTPSYRFIDDLINIVDNHLENMESILQFFISDLEPPAGEIILDKYLSAYSNDTWEKLESYGVYENLAIQKVCYTNSYNDLLHCPRNVSFFENTIGALSKYNAFLNKDNELNTQEVLYNLTCSNMSLQNNYDVNILDGISTFSVINVNDLFIIPSPYTDVTNKLLVRTKNNIAKWQDIQIADEITYGVVKIIDNFKIDSRESVVKGKNIADMVKYFDILLKEVESKLDALELSRSV